MNWDEYFIKMAYLVSEKSKDPSTKVGCVMVGQGKQIVSTGYNGLPRGLNDNINERNVKPEKLFWYEHAERNSIYNLALHGGSLMNCIAYITGPPCVDCARALIQVGIKEVVIPKKHVFSEKENSTWEQSFIKGKEMLIEANVIYREV